MPYEYKVEREKLFTDDGQKSFLKVRDKANRLLDDAHAFMMAALLGSGDGDCWQEMACVDRLVELGEIRELPTGGPGQDRVFVKA